MMIMSSPTQLLGPATSTTGEGVSSPNTGEDTGERSEQDFADLLAAAFAPVAAPNAPELLADGASAEAQADTAASSLAITSDKQTDFRSFWSLPLQAELTSQVSAAPAPVALSTTVATLSEASLAQINPLQLDLPTAQQIALAQQTTAPNSPDQVATSFAQYLPLSSQIENAQLTLTEPHEAGKSFSLTEFSRSNEMPARAARVVKDIVTEAEAIEPTSQASETRNFTEPKAATEPLLPEQAAPPAEAETSFMTQAQSAGLSSAATTAADKGAAQPIAAQALHPLVELAHQTAQRETRSLRFDLHPKEMGRVEVEVSRDAAGHVSATLNAEHADAAQALNHSLGHLREALEQAGVKVEQLHVFTSAQFQQQPNGQPHQQQAERATPLEALLLEPATEESSTEVEADKLLNLRA
jgi:flagellar hook-length control protein FliK